MQEFIRSQRQLFDNRLCFRRNIKWWVVFLSVFKRWSVRSISSKLNISSILKLRILSSFKKHLHINFTNQLKIAKSKSKLNEEHLEWIKEYLMHNTSRCFTSIEITQEFNRNFIESIQVSNSTIKRALKKSLEWSISKIERISKRATGQTHKRLLLESMPLQLILINKGYELVWIDEFCLSSRQDELYGWWSRGSKRCVLFDYWQFSMSFIVTFSKSVFYGIMNFEQTNNSETFGLLIKRLLSRIKSAF